LAKPIVSALLSVADCGVVVFALTAAVEFPLALMATTLKV